MRIILPPTITFDLSCKPWKTIKLTSKFSYILGILASYYLVYTNWAIHQVTHSYLCYRSFYADYYQWARLLRCQCSVALSSTFCRWLYCHHSSWCLFWQVQSSWSVYHCRCFRVYGGIYTALLWRSSGPVVCWGLSMCYRHIPNHRSWPCLGKLECRGRLKARSCDSDGHWHW